jgi:fucose permease
LGGYFIGQLVPTRLGNHVSFIGIFIGIGLIAFGCWYICDRLS